MSDMIGQLAITRYSINVCVKKEQNRSWSRTIRVGIGYSKVDGKNWMFTDLHDSIVSRWNERTRRWDTIIGKDLST